eukprot:12028-Heterococcus_DN1.PRE.1
MHLTTASSFTRNLCCMHSSKASSGNWLRQDAIKSRPKLELQDTPLRVSNLSQGPLVGQINRLSKTGRFELISGLLAREKRSSRLEQLDSLTAHYSAAVIAFLRGGRFAEADALVQEVCSAAAVAAASAADLTAAAADSTAAPSTTTAALTVPEVAAVPDADADAGTAAAVAAAAAAARTSTVWPAARDVLHICNQAMGSASKGKQYKRCLHYFDALCAVGAGVRPNSFSVGCAIGAALKSSQNELVLRLVATMQQRYGVAPNQITYGCAITAATRLSRSVVQFVELMQCDTEQFMYQGALDHESAAVLSQTARTLPVFAVPNQLNWWQQALDLLDEMKQAGLPPNVVHYSAALNAVARGAGASGIQHVESLLDRMTQEGVQPNHISYRTAITGCIAAADSAQVSTTATTETNSAATAAATVAATASPLHLAVRHAHAAISTCAAVVCLLVSHCNQHAHAKAAEYICHRSAAAASDAATSTATTTTTVTTAAAADREALADEPLEKTLSASHTPAGDAPPRRAASYWLMDEMASLGIKPDAYTYSFAISEVR